MAGQGLLGQVGACSQLATSADALQAGLQSHLAGPRRRAGPGSGDQLVPQPKALQAVEIEGLLILAGRVVEGEVDPGLC